MAKDGGGQTAPKRVRALRFQVFSAATACVYVLDWQNHTDTKRRVYQPT